MNNKKLERLLDAFFLLVSDKSKKYYALVKELVCICEAPHRTDSEGNNSLEKFFIQTLKSLLSDTVNKDDPNYVGKILLQLKMSLTNTGEIELADDIINMTLTKTKEETESPKEAKVYVSRIESFVKRNKIDTVLRQTWGILSTSEGLTDEDEVAGVKEVEKKLNSLCDALKQQNYGDGGVEPVGLIKLEHKASIDHALEKRSKRDVHGIIKSGLQGMNRALGSNKGLIPGESVCFCALSHHGKSLSILSWALWAVENTPKVDRNGKTPLVLLTSLENEEYRIMLDIFKRKYRQIEGKSGDHLSNEEISSWLAKYFAQFETKLIIERFTENYGIDEHRAKIDWYRNQGYDIVMSCIDYLSNMSISTDKRYLGIKELAHQLVNDARIYGYCLVTGHQLNREAARLAEFKTYPVKEYTMNHLADSADIMREFDVVFFQQKKTVRTSGRSYMTYQLAKHRHVENTDENHKFFCYEFLPDGVGIQDDLHTLPKFVSDPCNDIDFLSEGPLTSLPESSMSVSPIEDSFIF